MPQLTPEEMSAQFELTYSRKGQGVIDELEHAVLGAAFGGNSFTTASQALEAAREMALAPGSRLLALGSGAGWPGVFMAKATGCDVVLVDRFAEGAAAAATRAREHGVADLVRPVLGDGYALPFAGGSFDAVEHSDVLC